MEFKRSLFNIVSMFLVTAGAVCAATAPFVQAAGEKYDLSSDAALYVGPLALQRIQEQLSRQGHDPGPKDGMWGLSTASAIKSFQQTQGLAQTGNLNIETIQSLGVPEVLEGDFEIQAAAQHTGGQQEASGNGAPLFISPATLRDVQQALSDQGFEVGQVDGVWDEQTQQAIRKFQEENDITPSGQINVSMLDRLGAGQVVAALGFGSGGFGIQHQMAQQQTSDQLERRGYYRSGDQDQQQGAGATPIQGQGAPLYVGSDMVRQIQQALSDAGHDPGQPDGKWSSATQKALSEYQRSQNMAPTGMLTVASVQKLVGFSFD